MNKMKIALTLLTIAILVGPFAYILIEYRDNLFGLVLPPQFSSLTQGSLQNISEGVSGGNSSGTSSFLDSLNINQSSIQVPQIVGTPQYNPDTGAFNLAINTTNPLTEPVSISQLSMQIQSNDNTSLIGNISIPQSINIQPGQSDVINVTGTIPQNMFNQIVGQISGNSTGNINIDDFSIKNLNVTVDGVQMHFDEIDPSNFQSQLGQLIPGGS